MNESNAHCEQRKELKNMMLITLRRNIIVCSAVFLLAIFTTIFYASLAQALGGYWKPLPDKSYTVEFTDEAGNTVVGEFKKTVRWEWGNDGKVTITEWDETATFLLKDKAGAEQKIANETIKKNIADLAPNMSGKLKGNIKNTIKKK